MSRSPHRVPIEYRLALGVSSRHDLFDGTGILSLCARDPWVGFDNGGSLIMVQARHSIAPDLAPRVGASTATPRRRYSTGYGVRMGWNIEILVGSSRLGVLPEDFPIKPEINDGSLWHLAAILGTDRANVDFEVTQTPPYLYLTTNYQTVDEMWIPVEVDPDNAAIDPIELAPGGGRGTPDSMRMIVQLVARDNYRLVLPEYVPSIDVFELNEQSNVQPFKIIDMPRMVAFGSGFKTQVTFSDPLPTTHQRAPDGLGLGDGLLVNLGETAYGWKRFTIYSIDTEDRKKATLISPTDFTGSFTIPPAGPCSQIRGVVQNDDLYLPQYCIIPFTGTAPEKRQRELTGAWLIGRRGCPPGAGEPSAPPIGSEPSPPPGPPYTPGPCSQPLPTAEEGDTWDVQIFPPGPFTWNRPANYKPGAGNTVVDIIGGGGAGQSAQASTCNIWAGGGGGGGGGQRAGGAFDPADLPSSVSGIVGAGGTPGTGGGDSGNVTITFGTDGEDSKFGTSGDDWYLIALGGKAGTYGACETGNGGEGGGGTSPDAASTNTNGGGGGHSAQGFGGSSPSGGGSQCGAPGGGGGGYFLKDTAPHNAWGGAGGLPFSTAIGGGSPGGAPNYSGGTAGAGTPGTTGNADTPGGGGGGGGAAIGLSPAAKGGTGGDGGFPGGGGGGGGASGHSEGIGGDSGKGGDGIVRVTTLCH